MCTESKPIGSVRHVRLFNSPRAYCPSFQDVPETADGPGLFQLINGGAEVFVECGVKTAFLREYEHDSGGIYDLEVYLTSSEKSAQCIYSKRATGGGEAVQAGDAALMYHDYGIMRQGLHYVSVTGRRPLITCKNEFCN